MTHKILKSSLLPYPGALDDACRGFKTLVDRFVAELRAWHDHDIKAKALLDKPLRAKPQWRNFRKAPVIIAAMTDQQKTQAYLDANKTATDQWGKAYNEWQKEALERHEPYPRPTVHPDIEASVKTVINADGSITYEPEFEIDNDDPTPEQVLASKKSALIHRIIVAETAALDHAQLPLGKRRAANLRESDISQKDAKDRSLEETQHLADQQSRREKADAILRKAAQAMSEVEDLTPKNIDSYLVTDFG